jgi:hypothetical protein
VGKIRHSGGDGGYLNAPSGTFGAVCVDVVDMGWEESTMYHKWQPKIQLRWQIDREILAADFREAGKEVDTELLGKPFLVVKSYTNSDYEGAHLMTDLAGWRGRALTEEELASFDTEQLVGAQCMISLIQKRRKKGEGYYTVVNSVSKAPKGQSVEVSDYARAMNREGYLPPDYSAFGPGPHENVPQRQETPPHTDEDFDGDDENDDDIPF